MDFKTMDLHFQILSQYMPAIFGPHPNDSLESPLTSVERVKDFYAQLWPRNSHYSNRLMRIGGDFDGGYLLPANLDGIDWCFSPGSAGRATFENDLYRLFGIKSFVCDDWSELPGNNGSIAGFTSGLIGYNPSQAGEMTIKQWVHKSLGETPSRGSLLLQMDIEGGEYLFLLNEESATLELFKYIVVEFHYLYSLHNVEKYVLLRSALDRILETHSPVHVHPNDHTVYGCIDGNVMSHCLEVSFELKAQKDAHASFKQDKLPHPLDQPNIAGNQLVSFPKL